MTWDFWKALLKIRQNVRDYCCVVFANLSYADLQWSLRAPVYDIRFPRGSDGVWHSGLTRPCHRWWSLMCWWSTWDDTACCVVFSVKWMSVPGRWQTNYLTGLDWTANNSIMSTVTGRLVSRFVVCHSFVVNFNLFIYLFIYLWCTIVPKYAVSVFIRNLRLHYNCQFDHNHAQQCSNAGFQVCFEQNCYLHWYLAST